MSLKPWREVAIPHEDVLKGTFQQAEFAADISRVHQGTATDEYQDPALFFQRTYITEGTGKSHIAKAVAYQATLQGHNVRYLEADGAFAAYALGGDTEQRQQLRTLVDADLLILDDLFLARRISDKAGELLQTGARRSRRRSSSGNHRRCRARQRS